MTHSHTEAGQGDLTTLAGQQRHYAEARARMTAKKPQRTAEVRHWSWAPAPLPRKPVFDEATKFATIEPAPWQLIVGEVATKHGVTARDILGNARLRMFMPARQEAIYRIISELGLSFTVVGRLFHRDHTTILHSYRVHHAFVLTGQREGRDVMPISPSDAKSASDTEICHEVVVLVGLQRGITPAQIYGSQRRQSVFDARREVYFRLYRDHGFNFSQIGKLIGGRDHNTVISAIGDLLKDGPGALAA